MTQTNSPIRGSACRTPCMAIEPSVVKAAWSSGTASGTLTTRFWGTEMIPACEAVLPPQATRSPGLNAPSVSIDNSTVPAVL